MKKRNIIILLTILIILPLIVVTWFYTMNNYNQTLEFNPKENLAINYNNYVTRNFIDYRNGQFIWTANTIFGVTATVVDADGEIQKINGIGRHIQLMNGGTAFLKGNTLVTNKERRNNVAKNVDSFIVIGNGILYTQISESYDKNLYWYNTKTETSKVVAQNIAAYCADEEKLIVLDDSGWLTQYSATTVEKKTKLESHSYPVVLMLQNNCVIYKALNKLCILNLDTATIQEVALSENEYANNRISFICDSNRIIYSFQATRTDGSIVVDTESSYNGVWIINTITLEKQKICNETFEKLYLWEDILIGENEQRIYQINITTGETVKIIK